MDENMTEIITIVSSIVAVCHDNLPADRARHGGDILREMSEHAEKLSEMQALPEVTKESWQVIAKSSFAIASAMKALQKL
jgi:protein SPA2